MVHSGTGADAVSSLSPLLPPFVLIRFFPRKFMRFFPFWMDEWAGGLLVLLCLLSRSGHGYFQQFFFPPRPWFPDPLKGPPPLTGTILSRGRRLGIFFQ